MAEGNFFARLFGLNNANSTTVRKQQERVENAETNITESSGTTLRDAINFVAELQSYYYNDICKLQTDMIVQISMTQSEVNFINKKVKQDQIALSQIDEILNLMRENESEYHSIWGKSIYSFYDEIEKAKLATVQEKVFKIILRLCVVNTKPELKSIILKRIEKYKEAWNISGEIQIPVNYNVVLVEGNNGIEKYQFGEFTKNVIYNDNDKVLNSVQLDRIRAMNFEVEEEIPTNTVWVYVSSASRLQLNYMRRTCFIDNEWEYEPTKQDRLCLDIVKVDDLDQYLKGILQIILTKGNYAVISIVIPTDRMKRIIGPIEQRDNKVEICKKYQFYLKERNGLYENNLLTARVDRRCIPEKLRFLSYCEFRKIYF